MTDRPTYVLDTSAAIQFMRGEQSMTELVLAAEALLLPVIALGELYLGFERAAQPERELRKLKLLVPLCGILRPGNHTAREYARIKAELLNVGQPIPDNDVWVAAEARGLKLPLLANDAHFQRISGLHLVQP